MIVRRKKRICDIKKYCVKLIMLDKEIKKIISNPVELSAIERFQKVKEIMGKNSEEPIKGAFGSVDIDRNWKWLNEFLFDGAISESAFFIGSEIYELSEKGIFEVEVEVNEE